MNKLKNILILLAIIIIAWQYFNPKKVPVYKKIPGKDSLIYITKHDSTTITKVITEREPAPKINPDSLKRKWEIDKSEIKGYTKQIAELTTIKAKLEGELTSKDIILNEKEKDITTWKSKYMQIQQNNETKDIAYTYDAQIDLIGRNLPGNKEIEILATSPDKNLKINGLETFRKTYRYPQSILELNTELGVLYDFKNTLNPYGGLNLNILQDNRISPFVGAGYWINKNTLNPYLKGGVNVKLINWKR